MAIVKLHRLKDLQRYTLCATDGEIGTIEEFYFDDSDWCVRYLVVNTGGWLRRRRVLISPMAIGEVKESDRTLDIELSQDQIEHSPPFTGEGPVSREYEQEYLRYYGWPSYWQSSSFPGAATSFDPHRPLPPVYEDCDDPRKGKNNLRSSAEVSGYGIHAEDGEVGHVEDFVIDDQYWKVRYLEIDTRNWWPGKHVLLNPAWIDRVDWPAKRIGVDVSREDILTAPAYDPKAVISRDYEITLLEHYARRKYWE